MDMSLQGKNAVVCGSTQGIGLAIARELALLGASCTLLARNEQSLQEAVSSLDASAGQHHHYHVADFADPAKVKTVIEGHASRHAVHILVNNTGGPRPGMIVDARPEDFEKAFRQHVICNQVLATAVIPSMKKEHYGRIINIISTSIRIPIDNLGVSNTIRGAVASWAKTMANELGSYNITVNNLLPGLISTQRLEGLIEATVKKSGKNAEAVTENMLRQIPLKRFGNPSEIAAVAAFLASPAGSYVSGTSIPVDGGKTGSI
jgi:3-oxoacyl-[acyl-carrier protein] reductase